MASATKRQKTSNGGSTPQADAVISMSPEQQQPREVEGDPANEVNENQVNTILRNLRSSKTADGAVEAIQHLYQIFFPEGTPERTVTPTRMLVANLKDVTEKAATILFALMHWHSQSQSEDFAKYAIAILVSLTFSNDKARRFIVSSGAIRTILTTVSNYMNAHCCLAANVLLLLCHLLSTADVETKEEIATEECTDTVLQTMRTWRRMPKIQQFGCEYFSHIVVVKGMKAKLRRKNICSILGTNIDEFQESDPALYESAKHALNMYIN